MAEGESSLAVEFIGSGLGLGIQLWPNVSIWVENVDVTVCTRIIIEKSWLLKSEVATAKKVIETILNLVAWTWREEHWPYAKPLEGVTIWGVASLTSQKRAV